MIIRKIVIIEFSVEDVLSDYQIEPFGLGFGCGQGCFGFECLP